MLAAIVTIVIIIFLYHNLSGLHVLFNSQGRPQGTSYYSSFKDEEMRCRKVQYIAQTL